ncbi:Hypothetical protein SRAE_X000141600 [Strongyloides ratti]|uniref:Uncharacterized protein n=1 Tax=Strongyloides ratti TaxID=34506 RepID=A0A090KUY2_STRRB|nr:Hypothetical protein SRAE_X000141600 [Strongyloides ratti]CEF59670.1 Hypothetical protein SRAE_X000141600 [Strongyloides ratti]
MSRINLVNKKIDSYRKIGNLSDTGTKNNLEKVTFDSKILPRVSRSSTYYGLNRTINYYDYDGTFRHRIVDVEPRHRQRTNGIGGYGDSSESEDERIPIEYYIDYYFSDSSDNETTQEDDTFQRLISDNNFLGEIDESPILTRGRYVQTNSEILSRSSSLSPLPITSFTIGTLNIEDINQEKEKNENNTGKIKSTNQI